MLEFDLCGTGFLRLRSVYEPVHSSIECDFILGKNG